MVDLIAGNTYDLTIFYDDGVGSVRGYVEMVACDQVWLNIDGTPRMAMPVSLILEAVLVEPTLFD